MDRDHLTRLIDDPARVQRDDIADLKAMAQRYPWFSGAHLLLAVGGHREGDVLFDEQLRASAAHLPSRAVLFDELYSRGPVVSAPAHPLPFEPLAPLRIVAPAQPAPELSAHLHEATVTRIEAPALPSAVPEPPPTVPFQLEEKVFVQAPAEGIVLPVLEPVPVILPPLEIPRAEATPVHAPGEDLVPPEHLRTPWKERMLSDDHDVAELDRQMRDSAVAISYELLLEREGLREQEPPSGQGTTPPFELPAAVPLPETEPVRARSFADWLSEGTTETAAAHSAPRVPAPSTPRSTAAQPVVDPEIVRAVRQLQPIEPKHTPDTPETKALIERFLHQNTQPVAAPKKAEFFNPQIAAKRSLEEHADLVTETLARIYEKQGNIAKAIAAYERLAVKHPEKSAHFRALAKVLAGR